MYGKPLIGSCWASFRFRSSIGSRPNFHASSSTADSRANRYGTSGGARMNPGGWRSAVTLWTVPSMFSQAYSRHDDSIPARAKWSVLAVSSQPSWDRAVSLPSAVAPRRTWCRVSARNVRSVKPCVRSTTSLTGRFSRWAAKAIRAVDWASSPRLPKAPPTNGDSTRTSSGLIPSCSASPRW